MNGKVADCEESRLSQAYDGSGQTGCLMSWSEQNTGGEQTHRWRRREDPSVDAEHAEEPIADGEESNNEKSCTPASRVTELGERIPERRLASVRLAVYGPEEENGGEKEDACPSQHADVARG